MSLYVAIPPPDVAAVPFSASCPVYVRSLPGQRLVVAVFALGVGFPDYSETVETGAVFDPIQVHQNTGESSVVNGNAAAQSVDVHYPYQRRRHPCVPDSGGSVVDSSSAVFVIEHGRSHAVGELCRVPRYMATPGHETGGDLETGIDHGTSGTGRYTSVRSVLGIYLDHVGSRARNVIGEKITAVKYGAAFIITVGGNTLSPVVLLE